MHNYCLNKRLFERFIRNDDLNVWKMIRFTMCNFQNMIIIGRKLSPKFSKRNFNVWFMIWMIKNDSIYNVQLSKHDYHGNETSTSILK